MGWLWLAMIGAAAFAVLWLCRRRARAVDVRRLGADARRGGLCLATARDAGRPSGRGRFQTVRGPAGAGRVPVGDHAGKPGDEAVLTAADDRLREGDTAAAGQVMLDAIARDPGDATLWTGLGTALSMHDGGQVSPTALFAFRRAVSLAPDQPGPPFFLGLAYAQAGNLPAARPSWRRALALTPPDAPYRAI